MSTRRRNPLEKSVKDEPKFPNGLITPNSSMSNGTLTPKDEHIDVAFSDVTEAAFVSHDGLPGESDEGYATQEHQRQQRSSAPSLASRRRDSIDLTAMAAEPGESLQIVGQKVNLLVAAIEELRDLGLKELDTVLPELVLVGDQSAGKSTLLGAIAGINLPRSDGMCTKCPANIKTSPADIWSCIVSLTEHYAYTGKNARQQEFPPWEAKASGPSKKHFRTISNKSELEIIIRSAQAAILNPDQDSAHFLPTGIHHQPVLNASFKHKADFSPNLITIEISGPGLPALSLYDLPGNFVNPDHTDQTYLVKAFEKLSTSYIKHENAIVICAMSMHIDPGLSKTRGLITKLKAEKRTVGVLTMPDRMQIGSASLDYDKILRGKSHVLPRGYFVSRQPGPDFRLLPGADYHTQAREEEETYFNMDGRWSGEWNDFRNRCGTGAIQEYLSQELANLIVRSMGNMNAMITRHTDSVEEALRTLPALPGHNVQHVVRDRLQRFSNGVHRILEGGPNTNTFLSSWSQLGNDFRDTILVMRPMFNYKHSSDEDFREIISIDLDSDNESVTNPNTPVGRKRQSDNPMTGSSQRQKIYHESSPFSRESSSQPKQESSSTPSRRLFTQPMRPPPSPGVSFGNQKSVFERFLGAGKNFMSIADIRDFIEKHKRPGLPDHIADAAKEEICLLAIHPWKGPLDALAKSTFAMLRRSVLSLLQDCLGDYKQTELFRASQRHIIQFLDAHATEQRTLLDDLFKLETYKLFTINNAAFETYKAEELRILQAARRQRRVQCYVNKQARINRKPYTKDVHDDQLGPDPWANEIELAAYVRGYYKTAGLRFADNLCQSIQGHLFRDVDAEIMGLLENAMSLNEGDGEAKCRALMVEDENEGRLRNELQVKKQKWTVAASSLTELVRKYELANPIDDDENYDDHESPMRDDEDTPMSGHHDGMQGLVNGRPSPVPRL